MKKYLVAVQLGVGYTEGFIVEVANNYVPESDNMAKLKRKLVRKYHPCSTKLNVDYRDSSGNVNCVSYGNEIHPSSLKVIGLSRLDL